MSLKYGGATETEEQTRLRFQVELEFVQCLANPNYLNFLAQRGYFKDQAFINYLKYLLYWKDADYARYLKYPMCLYFLDLLQYEHFRREMVNAQCAKFIDEQQVLLWQHYTRRRTRLLQSRVDSLQSQCPTTATNSSGVNNIVSNNSINNTANISGTITTTAVINNSNNNSTNNTNSNSNNSNDVSQSTAARIPKTE